MPTGSASSQLSQWQRLNAGLSGPLAFEQDFSALDDPAASHDAAYAHEPYDFHEDGTPPAQPIDLHLLLSRFRSLDLRVRVLEAERSGAQQALWHHHRAATDSQRLRSLISPWAYMSSKVDAIRVSLQRALSRLSSLLITLQQSFPAIAQFFTEQALDSASYQGDGTGPTSLVPRTVLCTYSACILHSFHRLSIQKPFALGLTFSLQKRGVQRSLQWERPCPLPLKPLTSPPAWPPQMSLPLPPAKRTRRQRLYPRSLIRPNPIFLAQREWYDSQDKIFQGLIPPETPWQDDDLSAQPPSSASPQPTLNETSTEPQAPDQEPWLLPQPDTRLFNIFGDSFELQALKEKIAKGQMPPCLYKDPAAVDQQPLNRQELWAAMQYKPIYRTAGKWTYWDLLPDDIRKPPPQFCNEIEAWTSTIDEAGCAVLDLGGTLGLADKTGASYLVKAADKTWRELFGQSGRQNLARAIWSKRQTKLGASYLVKAADKTWRELFGQSGRQNLARAIWSKRQTKLGASYLVKAADKTWRELFGQSGRQNLARAIWSKRQTKLGASYLVKAADKTWRELFGQSGRQNLARAIWSKRQTKLGASYLVKAADKTWRELFGQSGRQNLARAIWSKRQTKLGASYLVKAADKTWRELFGQSGRQNLARAIWSKRQTKLGASYLVKAADKTWRELFGQSGRQNLARAIWSKRQTKLGASYLVKAADKTWRELFGQSGRQNLARAIWSKRQTKLGASYLVKAADKTWRELFGQSGRQNLARAIWSKRQTKLGASYLVKAADKTWRELFGQSGRQNLARAIWSKRQTKLGASYLVKAADKTWRELFGQSGRQNLARAIWSKRQTKLGASYLVKAADKTWRELFGQSGRQNLARAIWSKRQTKLGASYLVKAVDKTWRELFGQSG
ncbi:hypothetical protein AK812_SmicGene8223 [Symbiodinium microadriaticum]|uniref:Uncharacterized protein n=1 Tax=Symbiodinium microadriaticum TaxID=2951 RepID=A0A1Q9ELG0_SYMMI|nr:hypothetical protein AK812_SmicGene8223 [Symbiodinium microadriaticum]